VSDRVITIHYTRPPDHTTVFRQALVERTDECIVTLLEHTELERPVVVDGTTVLEHGAPVVWFTFPGLWHDIGRFHLRDGRFTGYYANILTPVRFVTPDEWETTDLFLDVWLDERGVVVLDEDDLEQALRERVITVHQAKRARAEAARLVALARAGKWPPAVCAEWTLERARAGTRGGFTG